VEDAGDTEVAEFVVKELSVYQTALPNAQVALSVAEEPAQITAGIALAVGAVDGVVVTVTVVAVETALSQVVLGFNIFTV
jgi:hypothetical protein